LTRQRKQRIASVLIGALQQTQQFLVRCHVIGRTIYVDYEAYAVGCEIMDTPDLFFTVPDSEKWPIIADSARPETISHMRAHGFP
jgi:phage terminase large subunit